MSARIENYDSDRAYQGYTLFAYTQIDPDEPAGIYLIDMEGELVHQWKVETALQSYCKLLRDGNLLYPTRDRTDLSAAGIRELTPDSEEVWFYHCRADHDMQVVGVTDNESPHIPDGRLLIHTLDDHMVPHIGNGLKRNPYIIDVDREGNLHWEWRGEDHFDEIRELLPAHDWAFVEDRIKNRYGFDWAHNNTAQIIPPNKTHETEVADGAPERFAPGNIVFSYRSLDVIGVIDYPSGEIVWAWGPGELDGQHLPHVLPSGKILIFDNGTEREWSRVIEVDPLTQEITWQYPAEPDPEFYSPAISGAKRLPNGNTLVCSGNQRWLFELTPDGDIVWETTDPCRELDVAGGSVYRAQRYSPEYVEPLLDRI